MTTWILGITLVLTLAPSAVFAQWDWQLDDQRFKQMNSFERAQYDKAASLVKQENFKAAAGEFEKFKMQFGDSPNLSYMLFMRGYSLHRAKDRNAAIKAYNEVIDFFGDQTRDAGAAMYFIGTAHLDNGDTLKGLQVLKQMIADDRFSRHPLTAAAIRQIAENHWRNFEFDEAVSNWQRVIRDFDPANRQPASRQATESLIACQTLRGLLPQAEQFLVEISPEKDRQNPAHRHKIAELVWDRANATMWDYKHRPDTLPKAFGDKLTPEQGKALYDWAVTTRSWWEQSDDPWGWHDRAAQTLVHYYRDEAEVKKILEEAAGYARATKDPLEADKRLARLADICREGGSYDLGNYCLQQMKERPWAKYKEHEILVSRGKIEEAAQVLQELEATGDVKWTNRAKLSRAELYRHRLNRQEEAIKLYTDINNPPSTLWAIQDSYMRLGKLEESIRVLSEIQNMFPDDAARALWQKAENNHRSGNKKQAASYAKALLSHYKDSSESSRAHQLLEDYGIKTGGGVTHE
jgi:tetratricopeptide (TPR) repeat protein